MEWSPYRHGDIAKSNHGYYFIYKRFIHEKKAYRWFTEYEDETDAFGKRGHPIGNLHGYESVEEAKAACEKSAKKGDEIFAL
jgi:hypothetical protein